jgi:hypothetical protein
MARIALTVAGMAAGAVIGYFFPPAGLAAWEAVVGGAMAGASVGRIAGAIVDPLHTQGPRLADLQVSSIANGTVIPFGYGTFRVSGNIIWAPGLIVNAQGPGVMGKVAGQSDTYNYYASFAAAFCQGPATIIRIWGDSTIIFDAGGPSYFPSKYFAPGQPPGNLCGVCAAFTDLEGNLIEASWIGHGTTLVVPTGATILQLGINNNYQATTAGGFTMQASVGDNLPTTVYVPSTAIPWEVVGSQNADYPFGDVGGTAPVIVFQNLVAGQTVTIAAMANPNVQGDGTNYTNGGGTYLGQITPDSTVSTTAEGHPTGNNIQWYGPDGDTNEQTGSSETTPPSSIYPAPNISPGTDDQEPNSLIQQYEGIENTPAFRGLCYAGWENLPLGNFGNRVPNIRAEISFGGTAELESVPNVVQYANAVGANGSITVTLPDIPGVNNTLIAVALFTAPVAVSAALPSGFTSLAPVVDAGPYGGGCMVGVATVAAVGNSRSWVFPCAAFPWPYNMGGYGAISCTIIEILGTPNVAATMGTAGTQTLSSPTSPLVGGSVDVQGPSLVISGFASYFNGIIEAGSYAPAAFNSPTINFSAVFSGFLSLRAVSGSDPLSGEITATLSNAGDAGDGTSQVVYLTITATFNNAGMYVAGNAPTDLSDVVKDICLRSGLDADQIDTSRLAGQQVIGYVVGRVTSGQQALQPLAAAYFFDAAEIDGVLAFIPRGQPSCMSIPEEDLGLLEDKRQYEETMGQEWDLPRSIQINFADPAINYQQNKQEKLRSAKVVKTRNKTVIEYPMALEPDQAMQIAEKSLFLAYLERRGFNLNLWKMLYNQLTPCDVIQFTGRGVVQQVRIVKTSQGAGGVLAITAVSEMPQIYLSSAVGAGNTRGGGTPAPTMPTITLLLFDIPLLRDVDSNAAGSGYYFAIETSSDFQSAQLYACTDNADFAAEGAVDATAVAYGTALDTLGCEGNGSPAAAFSPWVLDTANTLQIRLVASGSLANATLAQLINQGANALLVGGEVIQFETAVQQLDGSWIVSNLLRGRRGTDAACYTHGASETVVVLNAGGMVRVFAPAALLNVARYYRAVPSGATLDAVASQEWTFTGKDLKPWSPVAIGGSQDGSGNWTICWLRRARFGGSYGSGNEALVDGLNGPLNEASEQYQIDILGGTPLTVKRTLTVTSPTAIYPAAMQVTDFGSTQSTLLVNVYQMSAAVGRGFAGTADLPAATDATPVLPSGGQFYIN